MEEGIRGINGNGKKYNEVEDATPENVRVACMSFETSCLLLLLLARYASAQTLYTLNIQTICNK